MAVVPRQWAEANLDALLEENTHLSFYYFGRFLRSAQQESRPELSAVRMNKWNPAIAPLDDKRARS